MLDGYNRADYSHYDNSHVRQMSSYKFGVKTSNYLFGKKSDHIT
jgi:hypothetical protein